MSVVTQAGPAAPAGPAHPLEQRRPLGDRGFQILALACGLLVLVILAGIAISTSQQASSWFTTEGTTARRSITYTIGRDHRYGTTSVRSSATPTLTGTAITSAITAVMAVP